METDINNNNNINNILFEKIYTNEELLLLTVADLKNIC